MNKFIARAQELGKKAAELRQAVQSLPAHAAQIREAVTMTGGELKQLRADVQGNLQGLKADSEDRLLASMREINDHANVFEDAGYDLNGMDLDMALNQRLAVHLHRFEEVPHSSLRSLLGRQTSDTIRSILNGIIKAEETAANVELSHLVFRGLVVHIGVVPMIRMCWSDAEVESEPAHVTHPAPAAHPVSAPAPSPAPAPTSMFELRPMPGGSVRIESKPITASPLAPVPEPSYPEPASAHSSWSHDALARFKKMPGVSKYGR